MTRPVIPADLRSFITQHIVSVPYLEALLLMRRAGNAGLDRSSLAEALYVNQVAAGEVLAQLSEAGLVQALPASGRLAHYIYAAQPPQAALIDRLAEEYSNNLIGVSMLIHTTGLQTRL